MVVFRITFCKFNVGQCCCSPDEVYILLKPLFGETEASKVAVWCDDSAVGSCYYSEKYNYRISILEPPLKPFESVADSLHIELPIAPKNSLHKPLRPLKKEQIRKRVLLNRKKKR